MRLTRRRRRAWACEHRGFGARCALGVAHARPARPRARVP
jgi:hypothetical protein